MCLAIYKPADLTIPKNQLHNGYQGNWSDHCGCGFCWTEDGKLNVIKGLFTFEDFYDQYKKVEHRPMLVHFRLATHGPVNVENCHPFTMCDGQYALIHNGIFSIDLKDPKLSDTGNFAKYIMEPTIKAGKHKNKAVIERAIGWNYVAMMSADGEVTVYNDREEQWDNGVWFSNGGYKYGRSIYCD